MAARQRLPKTAQPRTTDKQKRGAALKRVAYRRLGDGVMGRKRAMAPYVKRIAEAQNQHS